ncbi:hypothetical protein ACG2LH_04765 [Zhouia sp. PK063]|uniref:hypothetical protein n=1 Tax=Zhouia sp. PK063 TaxID=3373602 RepID=UPI0037AEDE97
MKKKLVLISLFVLPIVTYLFFASGVHNFVKLPIVKENVGDLKGFHDVNAKPISMKGKISMVNFLGDNVEDIKASVFNLNEKIYKRFQGFNDFQMLFVLPEGLENDAQKLKDELSVTTNTSQINFAFGSPDQIRAYQQHLYNGISLNEHLYTPYVFIVDKDLNLRGRTDDDTKGKMYCYDASSVAELTNKMVDDVMVLLAEYRLELKKYNKDKSQRDSYLK